MADLPALGPDARTLRLTRTVESRTPRQRRFETPHVLRTTRPPRCWIDALASAPFAGNPAAVVLLEGWLPDGGTAELRCELANGNARRCRMVRLAGPATLCLRGEITVPL